MVEAPATFINSDANSSLMETGSQKPHHVKGGYPHALAEKSNPQLEEPLWRPPAVMAYHHEAAHFRGLTREAEESQQAS